MKPLIIVLKSEFRKCLPTFLALSLSYGIKSDIATNFGITKIKYVPFERKVTISQISISLWILHNVTVHKYWRVSPRRQERFKHQPVRAKDHNFCEIFAFRVFTQLHSSGVLHGFPEQSQQWFIYHSYLNY